MRVGSRIARQVCLVLVAVLAILVPLSFPALPAPLDVVLVLDQSGSMKQNDPQRLLVSAASDFVGKLGATDAAGLVLFGSQAKATFPLSSLSQDANRTALLEEIQRIRYSDPRTNIAAGIERGLYELKEHGRREATPILIFITDGIVDTGSAAKDAEMREWLRTRLLPEARERGVKIFGIALAEQADYALIQEMAQVTGGDYFRAMSSKEVSGIFERIYAKLQAPAPPSPSAGAAPPSPPPPPASMLAAAWFWVAVLAALALTVIAGLIGLRRLRVARAPAASASSSSATMAGKGSATDQVPEAYLRDGRTGKRIRLTKSVVRIGRAGDNDLVAAESRVSSHHAEIECRQGRFFLRDLRSTNGTWINKERLQAETLLKSGDVVAFDEFTFTFTGAEVAAAGTMIRDMREGTVVSDTLKRRMPEPRQPEPQQPEPRQPEPRQPEPRPAEPRPPVPRAPEPSPLSGTMAIGTESTLDDSMGPARCSNHSSFEATERCDSCGKLWCALCNPPVSGERLCRHCKEVRKTSGGRKSGRVDTPATAG